MWGQALVGVIFLLFAVKLSFHAIDWELLLLLQIAALGRLK
jgi:hypothetical protein